MSIIQEEEEVFKLPVPLLVPKKGCEMTEPLKDDKPTEDEMKEKEVKKSIPLDYGVPPWGQEPNLNKDYKIEILKCGTIVDTLTLTDKPYFVIGRLPTCDIPMEHPSLSRYHVVIQYKASDNSFYLYDLSSTHGTFHNKKRILPRTYVPIRVGHGVKLGGSTRLLIFQGPEEDMEEEIPMERMKKAMLLRQKAKEIEEDRKRIQGGEEDRGITWGMMEDAVEDEGKDTENSFLSIENNKSLYVDDPKRALRHWFERKGHELEYDCQENGYASFTCKVELPLETGPIIAESSVKGGKKKEAIIQCALEACRILDRLGFLRQCLQESRVKKVTKNWEENDFYASDEDEFLDRTGSIEKKRKQRRKSVKKIKDDVVVETCDSLASKLEVAKKDLCLAEDNLKMSQELQKEKETSADLDSYMDSLKDKSGLAIDKESLNKLKRKVFELREESVRLKRLIEIARPAPLPSLKVSPSSASVKNQLSGVVIGKRRGGGMFGKTRTIQEIPKASKAFTDTESRKSDPDELEYRGSNEKSDITKDSESNEISSHSEEKSKKDSEETSKIEQEEAEIGDPVPSPAKNNTFDQEPKEPKKKHIKNRHKRMKVETIDDETKVEGNYDASDPKYAVWTPPPGQTGDGRTALNDKYGY